ncbi:hypothetical protein [Flexithrix dorotheae]|uniref:hypothetical protein n=1 Tax=Flexithrix dorotheae TaxID=70993 RepID=UPI0012FC554A|nr:hypothetical protein [Flexithrix dorotheae]
MATTIDVGKAKNIHPENKIEVGYRLFLAAKKITYGKELVLTGPTFKELQVQKGKTIVSFSHPGSGLMEKSANYGLVKGFQ